MMKLLGKLLGDANERKIKAIRPLLFKINSLEEEIAKLSDEELRGKTAEFRQRLANGAPLDSLLPEAFATVREAGKRALGMRHFDVQMIGGIILHKGQIAEMRTGEGKTLVSTLPAYLNALPGKGVHVVTVNDYLAKRDSEWMGQLHRFLGLDVGLIQHHLYPHQRRMAYGADITYATNNELGFDYLRDNMAGTIEDCVQRKLHYAIVDEVDSILIDEARTPLIISGQLEQSADLYEKLARIAPKLKRDADYTLDEKAKNVILTEDGITHAEKLIGVRDLYDANNPELAHQLINALKAREIYLRDREYVVRVNPENGQHEVVIVDEFTGRLMVGRRYSDGLHQSIEAKEGVPIQDETQTLATITFQNYFRMYDKLSGMTGTAATEEAEFGKIYNLEVSIIPTNRPIQRRDLSDVVYKTVNAKFNAVADEIAEMHKAGRPTLVGTVSIEKSEFLSSILKERGLPHSVLNAKFHEQEAKIVAQAGRAGGITIATNMAGRGTDIILGGNPEGLTGELLVAAGYEDPTQAPAEAVIKAREEATRVCADEKAQVIQAGGLHIIGTERHESRRIDNQLRGRAGRQGDVGTTRFFLSLEDDLMRLFGGDRISKMMDRLNVPEEEAIEHGLVTRAIEGAQRKVEVYHFNIRKQVLEYDDVMNKQREIIYAERRKVLEGADMRENVLGMIKRVVSDLCDQFTNPQLQRDEWDFQGLMQGMADYIPLMGAIPQAEIEELVSPEAIKQHLTDAAIAAYEAKEATMQPEMLRQIERMLLLRVFDQKWIEHLHDIDALRDGIGLRAYGQKDPLQEYKREAYELFQNLLGAIQHDIVRQVFHVQVVYDMPQPEPMHIHNMVLQGPDGVEAYDPAAEESKNA
ncbi:preprotein translocase subunit SecA [bacterium]|nr:preprotein translocase subunit SecA [bacterium]